MQDLAESRVTKLNAIWSRAAHIEGETLHRSNEYVKHLASEIPRNNPVLDSMMYVRHNAGPWQEPVNCAFEPSPVWLDDDRMASTESAKTFLRNVLGKRKGQLGELKISTDQKRKELDNAKRIKQNIREGREKKVDEIECARGIFQLLDQLHAVERQKISAETEVLTVVAAVGDVSRGARSHEFKAQTFKIPTNCDLCGERIWGLSAKGFDCRDCGFTCHSKCELKVPADCPGEQDKDARRRLKVERQEAARVHVVEEVIPERQSAAPPLTRSDTINSMNTLSSGYSANPRPSIAEPMTTPQANQNGEDDGPPKPKPKAIITSKPRVLAPPPVAYIAPPTNGDIDEGKENRGKMLYSYQKTGADEISVDESTEVAILEPDGKLLAVVDILSLMNDRWLWLDESSGRATRRPRARFLRRGTRPHFSSTLRCRTTALDILCLLRLPGRKHRQLDYRRSEEKRTSSRAKARRQKAAVR